MSHHLIKVVFFDAAGTLFHVNESVADVYLHYAQKYGVKPSQETKQAIDAAFKQAFREAPPPVFAVNQPEKLKQSERLWWFDVVHAVFYRVGLFEGFDQYFEEVFEAFAGAKHWKLFPETVSVLEELKRVGYELGVVSNFDTRLFGILRELKLIDYFDSVTISSLAGAAKPAKKIFQYALDQHAVDPEEAVHVGDSVGEDLQGAHMSNLKGVLLNRHQNVYDGITTIQSLQELPMILSQL